METIDISKAQLGLLRAWLAGAIPAFLIVLILSFDKNTATAGLWAWLMPSIMPTLLMVVGTCAGAALTNQRPRQVSLTFYRATMAISLFYLVIVTVTIYGAIHWSSNGPEQLAQSSAYMGPLQGLASLSLGAFFVSRKS